MIPVIDNPEILALYAARKPAPEGEQPAMPEPEIVRAPEGNGHESAVRQMGGQR